jgi:uncharacterized membrane protein YkvA (DUF1232 family)
MLLERYGNEAERLGEIKVLEQIKAKVLPKNLTDKVSHVIALIISEKSWAKKLILLTALVYVICIFDVCPDVIPYLGYIDDLAVILYALSSYGE